MAKKKSFSVLVIALALVPGVLFAAKDPPRLDRQITNERVIKPALVARDLSIGALFVKCTSPSFLSVGWKVKSNPAANVPIKVHTKANGQVIKSVSYSPGWTYKSFFDKTIVYQHSSSAPILVEAIIDPDNNMNETNENNNKVSMTCNP